MSWSYAVPLLVPKTHAGQIFGVVVHPNLAAQMFDCPLVLTLTPETQFDQKDLIGNAHSAPVSMAL
jgi:hypothetical protein